MEVSGVKPEETASQEAKRRPLKSFRINDVSASVWSRDHEVRGEARTYYSITFERAYRDAMGQYRYTRSFSPDDLGSLMSLCQQSGEYINSLRGLVQSTSED